MQNKLKIAFILISFAATMLTVYAANQVPADQHTVGGLDVSRLSPGMFSISPMVSGHDHPADAIPRDSVVNGVVKLSIETTNN